MEQKQLPSRDQIPEPFRWRLSDIYQDEQAWEQDVAVIQQQLPQLQAYRGQMTTAEQLEDCLRRRDQILQTMDKVVAYALMGKDADNTNDTFQGYADRAMSLSVRAGEAMAFIEPEILSLPSQTVQTWTETREGLRVYRHYLADIMRTKPHTLPTEQEELLASAGEIAQAPSNIFRMFNNADLRFPTVTDADGQDVELTHGRYIQLMENNDRRVRQDTFAAMYATYGAWKNTIATMYASAIKQSQFYAKARKYASSLVAALDRDNVKVEVYENLIATVHQHLPLFHRYMEMRQRLLDLDELHLYDVYVPVVQNIEMKIPHEQAMEMVLQGLKPLGDKYSVDLRKGFAEGWIDWFESRGKTSGAYSWGAYGVHPYVLMNYQDNMDNMFTLAHEMGHAMHSYYSDRNQEFVNAQYTIFVAEVASTLNEALVMADLLQKTQDQRTRMYLLNHYLEQFRGTMFRQTMFAEFEMLTHQRAASGESLTADSLSTTYYDLNKRYFGDGVIIDQEIAIEWARIPHFYRPFYVYKYATGFAAAIALSQQILQEGEAAVARYLQFLSSGGSDYPVELLKKAGVDMSSPQPIVQAMQVFDQLLVEMEDLSRS